MWDCLSFAVFLALISLCASCCDKRLRFDPINLNAVYGENISISCIINDGSLRTRYTASDLVFKFELDPSVPLSDEASSKECDYSPSDEAASNEEQTVPEDEEEEDIGSASNCPDFLSNCEEDLNDYEVDGVSSLNVDPKYVKVIDRYKARLEYPPLSRRFIDGNLVCCIDDERNSTCKKVHILVGDRPHVPIIGNSSVKDWKTFKFHWKTEKINERYRTTYRPWYKLSSSEDFLQCPVKNCDQFCEVDIDLGLDRDLSDASRIVVKVNASNPVGVATSPEEVIDLYDIVTPDPVHGIIITTVNFSICVKFKSPKPGAKMRYKVLVNCSGQPGVTRDVPRSSASNLEECFPDLPPYVSCGVSIQAKPSGYGQWSKWSNQKWLTTPQKVPLAAPKVCRSCFEVLSTNDTRRCNIRVFPKPLSKAVARGRVMTYRASLTMHNHQPTPVTTSIVFKGDSSALDFNDLDLTSSYSVTVVAETEAGYNESIIASPVLLDLMAIKQLRSGPRNITAFIVDSTTVRMSWLSEHQKLSGFTIFWCRMLRLNQCKDPLQWSRVSSNVTRFDITGLPAFDLLNYLFGIAMETVDGYSSGVVWTKCLYNLSRVSSPPQIDPLVNGTKVRLNFTRESECNAGFPYAYRIEYCPKSKSNKICNGGSATELIVGDDTCEVSHLASDTKYLFIVSSLSVAGPSLRNSTLELETRSEGGSAKIEGTTIIIVIVIGGIVSFAFVLGAVFRQKIRSWSNINIASPPVVQRDNHVRTQNFSEDEDPGYAQINQPETSCDVHENGSGLNNDWSETINSSTAHLIPRNLDIVPYPTFRGCGIAEDSEDDDDVSVFTSDVNYAQGNLQNRPDILPSSPPVEPSFPGDSSISNSRNCIVLEFGDVSNEPRDLPPPQLLPDAPGGVHDGNSFNASSCGYAVGHMEDRHSGPTPSATANDVSVQMDGSRNDTDASNDHLPLNSLVIDLPDEADNANGTQNVHALSHPSDSPDDIISVTDDDVTSDHLQPYSEVLPPEGSGSRDDDYDSSMCSSSGYAVANLNRNKEYDSRLDAPASDVIYDSDNDSNADEYAAVSLLNNKQTAGSSDSLPQPSNIPHFSVPVYNPALSL